MGWEGKRIGRAWGVAAAALLLAAPIATGGRLGVVNGQILDSTCFGPCVEGQEPTPYRGEARVIVTQPPKRRAIDELTPGADGSFTARLGPGRYKFRIRIEDPCYIEDKRILTLSPGGDIDGPEFFVYNDCIK